MYDTTDTGGVPTHGRSLWGGLWPWVAVAIAVGLVLAQYAFRPLWRDEYWALYFSAPHDPLAVTFAENMTRDVHPPLYFVLLHFWRQLSDADLFARLFNVAVIGLGALAAWGLRGAQRRDETTAYFFLCATSFWAVFFAAEARMMIMLYVLCALSVLIARNALDKPQSLWSMPACYVLVGVLAASIHFFGSLWVACLGAAVGFAFLFQKRIGHFMVWALASCLAIAPALIWILAVRPDMNYGAPSELPPFWENFTYGINQLLRGVIVKTVFANILVFGAAALGLAALWRARGRDVVPVVMLAAIGLCIAISLAIHVGWVSMIKERAYIVIIPAMLYVVAAAIQHLQPVQRRALWMVRWAPLAAALSLPLFSSELFKDRENVGPVRAMLAQAPQCANQPVVMVLRRSEQGWDYADFMAREVLKGASPAGDIQMLALDVLLAQGKTAPTTACPIKVIAIGAPRGERDFHASMRDDLARVGLAPESLEEKVFGGGRTRVFVGRTP